MSAGEGLSDGLWGSQQFPPGGAHEGREYTRAEKLAIVSQIYEALVRDKMARA
jgi:hypothetical protein